MGFRDSRFGVLGFMCKALGFRCGYGVAHTKEAS